MSARNLYFFLGGYEKKGAAEAGFSASATGDAEFARGGLAAADFSASGDDNRHHRSGLVALDLTASGGGAKESARAGSSVSAYVASGFSSDTYERVGTAVLVRSGTGDGRWTVVKRNVATGFGAPNIGQGFEHNASGAAEKNVGRTGTGKSVFKVQGRQGDAVYGAAASAFTVLPGEKHGEWTRVSGLTPYTYNYPYSYFSARSLADVVLSRTGFTVRGYAGTGASAITYAETGTAEQGRSAAGFGDKFDGTGWTYLRYGLLTAPFVGSGSDTSESSEAGTALLEATAHGFVHPAGTAIAVMSGSGWLRGLVSNDMFANREIIDPPTGVIEIDEGYRSYDLAGTSSGATTESGERLSTYYTLSKTLWWQYTVPTQCIVKLNVVPLNMPVLRALGLLSKGTAVNALTSYADAYLHFGQDGGRGIESRYTGTSSVYWGTFPHPTGETFYVQASPETPLVFNTGRTTWVPTSQDVHYRVQIERFLPPENDAIASPMELGAAGGTVAWDMAAATGDGRWNWTQLDSVMLAPSSNRLLADLFYRFTPEQDGSIRLRATYTTYGSNGGQVLVFRGTDPDTWVPEVIDGGLYGVYVAHAASAGWYEVPVLAGETYTVALIQTRYVYNYPPYGVVSMLISGRMTGDLQWEFVTAPTNDNFADRLDIGTAQPGSTTVADTRGSTQEDSEPFDPHENTAVGVWYEYAAPTSGWYQFWVDAGAPVGLPSFTIFRGTGFVDMEYVATSYYWYVWLRAGETVFPRITALAGSAFDHGNLSWELDVATVAPNDDFANRITLSGASGSQSFDITGATSEAGEPITYYWNGGQSPTLWYEWTAPSTGGFAFEIQGSYYDYVSIGVYTGSSVSSLTPIARFETESNKLAFSAQAGVSYKIQIGYFPSNTYLPLTMSLVWGPEALAANTSFASAADISGVAGSISASNYGADAVPEAGTPDLSALAYDDFRQGRAVWYRFEAPITGDYVFTVDTPNWDFAGAVFHGDSLGALVVAEDDSGDPAMTWGGWGGDEIWARLTGGQVYHILIVGISYPWWWQNPWMLVSDSMWEADMIPQGDLALSWSATNLGDDIANAQEDLFHLGYFQSYVYEGAENGPYYSYPAGGCRSASNIGATAEPGEPSHGGGEPATRSVWFYLYPGAGGTYKIWVEPIGDTPVQDPILAVYDYYGTGGYAATASTLKPALATNDNFNGLYPQVLVSLFAYTRYLVVVDARDEGTFILKFQRQPVPAAPSNDNFASATPITEETVYNGTTVGATVECGETPAAGYWGGPYGSVWYTFTPTEAGSAFLSMTTGTHPTGAYLIADVFQGSSLGDLVNITPADTYWSVAYNETTGFPFSFTGDAPVYIRFSHYEDGADYSDGNGGPFTFYLDAESTTPPSNDDSEDAPPATGGTNPGNTDGATLEPGEVNPRGGLLTNQRTTWHKYIAPSPGFVAIYTTRATPKDDWYRIGVWAGATKETALAVNAYEQDPTSYLAPNGVHRPYFEVREGETYWIQVVREGHQSWGDYDLHIDEYLETKEWDLETDGFTSTTNSPSVSGGTMTCTGSQAGLTTLLDVLPQYGTVDMGADIPKWGREFRIHFEVRVVGGQVLQRQLWHGGDDWSFANAASDDHINLTMRRVGLLRARDKDGTHVLALSLATGAKGENNLQLTTSGGSISAPVSLGAAGPQHDSGWVSVELVLAAHNYQRYDGSVPSGSYPQWKASMIVDQLPVPGTATYAGKQLRYLDFGMFRHPSMGVPGAEYDYDPRYCEDNEAWTYEMRRMRATNIQPHDPYDLGFSGDYGVYEFDGYPSEVPWSIAGGNHSYSTTTYGAVPPVVAAPDKPGWGAVRSTHPTPGQKTQIAYGGASSSRRWYAISIRADEFPASKARIGGYYAPTGATGLTTYSMGDLYLQADGELRIKPYGTRDFCVAHLAPGQWYWIEVHVDSEVMWDVRCTVFINGQAFGTYSNAYTWAEVGALYYGQLPLGVLPGAGGYLSTLSFGYFRTTTNADTNHDIYFTNTVAGRGVSPTPNGPLQAVALPAADSVLGHYLPDWPSDPADRMELKTSGGGDHAVLYNWSHETAGGPWTITIPSGETQTGMYTGIILPRYWEPIAGIRPTTGLSEQSVGAGNAWSPVGQGNTRVGDGVAVEAVASTAELKITKFGQSVPVTAPISGIEVRVHRKATTANVNDLIVQTVKGGVVGGTNLGQGSSVKWDTDWEVAVYGGEGELWGRTWTPQEINASDFGVAIQAEGSGTAQVDMVTVKVYYADPGGPANIGRGAYLPPIGLYNFVGDTLVSEWTASGTGQTGVGWWSGGEPSGPSGGTASQRWASCYPMWLWQARGDKQHEINLSGSSGDSSTVSGYRMVRNPYVFPRFAWSTDNGSTWTRILIGEDESSNHISGDVGAVTTGHAVFLDNVAAYDRLYLNPNGWDSGLSETRPSADYAHRYPYWYLAYTGTATTEAVVHATNLWAKWRPYANHPSTANGSIGTFRAHAVLPDGNQRRVGTYTATAGSFPSSAPPWTGRFTSSRAPDGAAWTPQKFNDLQLRLGYNQRTGTGAVHAVGLQDQGAAVYAATWEILVPADPDPPPAPCGSPKYGANITVKQ